MTNQEVLKRLKDGNKRYVADKMKRELQDSARRAELVAGQEPFAIILSCSDSRVVPELAFDTGLGELFIVRVAGNIANTDAIASIEYAVHHLHARTIVVLGHQSCGAVKAAIGGGDNGYNLNHLLAHITPAIAAAGSGASTDEVVKKNAALNADALIERSPILRDYKKELKIHAAYYNLDSGRVDFL